MTRAEFKRLVMQYGATRFLLGESWGNDSEASPVDDAVFDQRRTDATVARKRLLAAWDALALDAARLDYWGQRWTQTAPQGFSPARSWIVWGTPVDTIRSALDTARAAQPPASADATHSAGAS